MAVSARHSLVLSEREHSCGPTPPVRSWACATRWRAASRSRPATWTAPPDARRACRRETEHPCFRLGSSSPEASQTAPDDALARCTPTTVRERLDVALLSARVARVRNSDAADPLLAEALAVAKIEGFVVAVTDDLVNSDRVSRCFSGQDTSSNTSRPFSIASNRTRPTERERQHVGTAQQPRTHRRSIPRVPTHEQEIAAELFVSNNTLKTHVKRIYQKLGVSSRMDAVSEARRLGLF